MLASDRRTESKTTMAKRAPKKSRVHFSILRNYHAATIKNHVIDAQDKGMQDEP
jgi:hypothetical protein